MRELICCLFKKNCLFYVYFLVVLMLLCLLLFHFFLFLFMLLILGVKWMCRKLKQVNYLDDTKNNFIMDECDNQRETKTSFNPRHPVSGEN